MPDASLTPFIAGLPKAELHVHLVGSAAPDVVAALAARHEGQTDVPTDPAAVAEFFTFTGFDHFIDVFRSVVDLVRDPEDVRTLAYGVAAGLATQNVRYAEVTCTPRSSMRRGMAGEAFVEAIEDARRAAERDFGVVLRWCFDIPGAGSDLGTETIDLIERVRPDALVSIGLGGPERPRRLFEPCFDRARALGLRSVPHAGEMAGAEEVWDALRLLKAERIGHGVRALEDPALLDHLAEQRVPLEICPTSNVATRAVAALADHPIKRLADAGVPVTVNSDDPTMFGTDLNTEYEIAARLLGLDEAGVAELARDAVRASFLDAAGRRRLLDEIDVYSARRQQSRHQLRQQERPDPGNTPRSAD